LKGKTLPQFVYKDRGSMATIGRNAAVVDLGKMHYSGFLGWLMWVFIHLLYIEQAHNRILILAQWAWSYITWNRSARLITFDSGIGDPTQPADDPDKSARSPKSA
jgi:NADH dehydrogenase